MNDPKIERFLDDYFLRQMEDELFIQNERIPAQLASLDRKLKQTSRRRTPAKRKPSISQ